MNALRSPGRLVLVLALLSAGPDLRAAPSPFEILPSTRTVTCLSASEGKVLVGTTGGLVLHDPAATGPAGAADVLLPGVPVRALEGDLVATDRGLFRLRERRLESVLELPTAAVTPTPGGFLRGARRLTGHPMGKVRLWREGEAVDEVQFPTRAPIHSVVTEGEELLAASIEGMWRLRAGKVTEEVLAPEEPLTRSITCLRRVGERLLAGTPVGLYEYRSQRWQRIEEDRAAASGVHVTALAPRGEHVLVATAGEGLHQLEGDRLRTLPRAFLHASAVLAREDALYVGTPRDGAFLHGVPPRALADLGREPPGNTITALAYAQDFETLVVGTFSEGLGLLQWGGWRHFGKDEGLPSSWINHVTSDGRRLLVRFSDGSVYTQIEKRRFRQLGAGDHWPKNWTSAVGTSEGRQWVGTESAFYLRSPTGWDVFAPRPELTGNLVLDVALLHPEAWIATHRNGLYRWDSLRDEWRRYGLGAGLTDTWVTCIETFRGEVWAGTFDGGVCRLPNTLEARVRDPGKELDASRWRSYGAGGEGARLPSDAVAAMVATDQELWIGTLEGLVRTDGERFTRYGVADGMPSPNVMSLTVAGDTLWVGTDSGLCRASLASLRAR